MIKIPYDDIISKISAQASLGKADIDSRIEKKMEQLSGLISKEGAAHIIANELGVKLLETQPTGQMMISQVLPGMKSVDLIGRVQQVYETRTFNSKGRDGKVGSFLLNDGTGAIRVVLWNDQVSNLEILKLGQIVKLLSAMSKDNNGRKEVHINDRSKFILDPPGVVLGELKSRVEQQQSVIRKNIKDLAENDQNVEVLGTVVQVFNLRFFEVCPECSKRAKPRGDDGFFCDQHARVSPAYSYVLNAVVDDGTANVRTVMFRNQAERLLNLNEKEIVSLKDNPNGFEDIKHDLIGTVVKISGRINKNPMFDRMELVSNAVVTGVDPQEEVNRLQVEVAQLKEKSGLPDIDSI